VTDGGPEAFELDGQHYAFDDWGSVPTPLMNRLIAQCAQQGISGASNLSATGSGSGRKGGERDAGGKRAQQATTNSDHKSVCFSFRDTGTCSRGEQCRFAHTVVDSTSASASGSGSDTTQRRGKTDFTKAGPCPNGADFMSWTFGKDSNGDVVALSPKRGPFLSVQPLQRGGWRTHCRSAV
jgi:hypothetical protein